MHEHNKHKSWSKTKFTLVGITIWATAVVTAADPVRKDFLELNYVSPFLYTGDDANYQAFGLQGIKGGDTPGTYLITGTSGDNGVVYSGPVNHGFTSSGSGTGNWYMINVPADFYANSTSIYGVDNLGGGSVDLVGSYVSADGTNPRIGFFYSGSLDPATGIFKSYQARNLRTNKLADFTSTSIAWMRGWRSATMTSSAMATPQGTLSFMTQTTVKTHS